MLRSGIKQAAEFIREGGLVVFPTETVYGLGADAFNAQAVARVYSEKGRPSDNPLILHIANLEQFKELAYNPPKYAFELIKACWPGPLTLVVKKNLSLPAWVGTHPNNQTDTIGIRMPAHPMAQALIEEAGIIAAPSANKSGKPSPTTLAHVLEDFPELNGTEKEQEIFGIKTLDGGSAVVGLESTVVDITGDMPVVLRPGSVTAEKIFALTSTGGILPPVEIASPTDAQNPQVGFAPRSPGVKYKHYAPRAAMTLVSGEADNVAAYIIGECEKKPDCRVGVLVRDGMRPLFASGPANMELLLLGGDEQTIAQNLFDRLRQFDKLGVGLIYAEVIPENGLGMAIMDRMRKAAEGKILNV